jgi:hypothetical protein
MKMKLSDTEWNAIERALRIAADQYDSDAHDASCAPNHERIERCFKDQAMLARTIADKIIV